jgi:cysteine desulfurase
VRAAAAQLAREGCTVESIALDASGDVDMQRFAGQLRPDTALVAQMLVNNEFGTIYPVARMARLVRARASEAAFVVDAVQAFGKLDCALTELGCDALLVSAHKIGGPKGAGALALARPMMLAPLIYGGGQEAGLRAGTENVLGIVGFGAAAADVHAERELRLGRVAELRKRLVARLAMLKGVRVIAPGALQVPHIVCVSIAGAPAEVRMHHLERHGVFVSAGSACQKPSRGLSPALTAVGVTEDEIRRVVRISMAADTRVADIDIAVEAFASVGRELEHAGA